VSVAPALYAPDREEAASRDNAGAAGHGRCHHERMQHDGAPGDDHGQPASERVRLRRLPDRGRYLADDVRAVLDAGVVAHVGVSTPAGPIVLPMAYGLNDEWLYLHGSVANAALRAAIGEEVCVTVTLVDGLVVGRTPFHSSMNYRCAVVRGRARRVEDGREREAALRLVSDHLVSTWDTARPPTESELRRTLVLAVPLVEASVKVRSGDPVDEPEDLDGPHWAGHVPLSVRWEAPVPSADLPAGIPVPDALAALPGTPASPPP
jgi:uncharacterized protein